jgi:hypothetical protein
VLVVYFDPLYEGSLKWRLRASPELTATGNKNHSGCFVSKIAYGLLGEGLL